MTDPPSLPPGAIPVDAAVFVRRISLADARFGATVSRLDYAIGVCGLHSTTPHIPLHFAISAFLVLFVTILLAYFNGHEFVGLDLIQVGGRPATNGDGVRLTFTSMNSSLACI